MYINSKPKIGVLIVAYNAKATINNVLSRIKPKTWDRISEVFIFDDSSFDNTPRIASDFIKKNKLSKVKIFKNQINLGYGGNQKRGYLYAIKKKFDIVVLLHGDGQYAPEVMDRLIDPLYDGKAHAVLGSRMLAGNMALRENMPLYKYIGNKILTAFQNNVMGMKFSEYHSGYRVYSVHALKEIPFLKNSNEFHFDNEIIIQFIQSNFKIKEVPIPTYYGGEISYVNGFVYAFNVFKTIIKYRLHKAGLLFAKQFDLRKTEKYSVNKNKFSSHNKIFEIIKASSTDKRWKVLDVGCGSGILTKLTRGLGHYVVGVDLHDSAVARSSCDEFHIADVEKSFGINKNYMFDCIILADILEHTRNPEEVLLRARRHLKASGIIIVSTANVANFYIRLNLIMGNFEYTERGILDSTHYRLFTLQSFKSLIQDCGLKVIQKRFTPIPFI